MILDRSNVDDETLERAEREAMQRPSNSSMWDERLYNTHAPVMSWAERGSDLLEESNYLKVLEHLLTAAGDDADEHVIDASISDWLVGSLRQMFVQVRNPDGTFTEVWHEAVTVALSLRDEYPVFDEGDYSQREFDRWQGQVLEALRDCTHDIDTVALDDVLVDEAVTWLQEHDDLDYLGVPDRAALTAAYEAVRDQHYAQLGSEVLGAQIEGQGALL